MIESTELDDPDEDEPPAAALTQGAGEPEQDFPEPAGADGHRPEIEEEFAAWRGQDVADRRAALRQVIDGNRAATPEVLVCLSGVAYGEGDRPTLNLAFEALSKTVTPLLLSQAWGMSPDERREQAQQILLETFAAIRGGRPKRAKPHGKKREHGLVLGDLGLTTRAHVRHPAQDGRLLRAIIACNVHWLAYQRRSGHIARNKPGV